MFYKQSGNLSCKPLLLIPILSLGACQSKESILRKKVQNASAGQTRIAASLQDGLLLLKGQNLDKEEAFLLTQKIIQTPEIRHIRYELYFKETEAAPFSPGTALPGLQQNFQREYPGLKVQLKDSLIHISGNLSARMWKKFKQSINDIPSSAIDYSELKLL